MRTEHIWHVGFLICFLLITSKGSNPDSERVQEVDIPAAKPSGDASLVAELVNDLSFKLLDELNPTGNSAVSPISIFLALAMSYLGSGGRTKKQLEDVMGMNSHGLHGNSFHEKLKELVSRITPHNDEVKLQIANALIISKEFQTKPEFSSGLTRLYSVLFQEVDFKNGDHLMKMLNGWVANNTGNLIHRILSSPPDPMSRMFLLSAVYFKGTWKTHFPENETRNQSFTLPDDTVKTVQMMTLTKERVKFFYDQELNCTFVKLPYKGGNISMIIALPGSVTGSPPLRMTHEFLCHIQQRMRLIQVDTLSIPRFRIRYSQKLNTVLKSLGATDMFDGCYANFSRMSNSEELYVSSIRHKAVVEVNERGTVAAAVTSVEYHGLSMQRSVKFIADHPFNYYIVDEGSGVALFHGKVLDPTAGEGGRFIDRQKPPLRTEPPRTEPPRTQPPRTQPPKTQPLWVQPPREQPPRAHPPRAQPPRLRPNRNKENKIVYGARIIVFG